MNTKVVSSLMSCLAVSAAMFLSGCGDKEEKQANQAPAAQSQPVAPAADVNIGTVQPPPVVAPPPPGAAAAAMPAANDGVHESAPVDAKAKERIEAALQSYVIDHSANPSSLEELVQKKYLRSLPEAPAGKKWAYNTEKVGVELVDINQK